MESFKIHKRFLMTQLSVTCAWDNFKYKIQKESFEIHTRFIIPQLSLTCAWVFLTRLAGVRGEARGMTRQHGCRAGSGAPGIPALLRSQGIHSWDPAIDLFTILGVVKLLIHIHCFLLYPIDPGKASSLKIDVKQHSVHFDLTRGRDLSF